MMSHMRIWRCLILGAVVGGGGACGNVQAEPSLPTWHAGSGSYYSLPSAVNLNGALSYLNREYVRNGRSLNRLQFPTNVFTANGIRRISGRVSVVVRGGSAVILTSYGPGSGDSTKGICYGMLWVVKPDSAVFSDYPVTAHVGSYFFVAPYPKLNGCRAGDVRPPPPHLAGSYLSTKGFP